MLYQYIIIIAVLLIVALAIVRLNRKDVRIEMNKLVHYLGGKDNILNVEKNIPIALLLDMQGPEVRTGKLEVGVKGKVTLKDVTIVNKDAIQKLGARGIVEIDNQLKIILGSEAKTLKKYIDEYILDNKK